MLTKHDSSFLQTNQRIKASSNDPPTIFNVIDKRPELIIIIPSCCNYLAGKFPPDAASYCNFHVLHGLLLPVSNKKPFADG